MPSDIESNGTLHDRIAPSSGKLLGTKPIRVLDAEGLEHAFDLGILRLQPGDRVVVSCPQKLNQDVSWRLKDLLDAYLPKGVYALVLDEGVKVDGILRGSE